MSIAVFVARAFLSASIQSAFASGVLPGLCAAVSSDWMTSALRFVFGPGD